MHAFRTAEEFRAHLPCERCEDPQHTEARAIARDGFHIKFGVKIAQLSIPSRTVETARTIILETNSLPELIIALQEVYKVTHPTLVADDEWRGIAADMIRLGRDAEAVAMLVEKAPHVTPYIKALEDFLAAFAALPALDAYERMVQRSAGHWTGRIEMREQIAVYARAIETWKKAMSVQNP
jgi:hypothetical protein